MRNMILAGALLVGVTACGDDDNGSDKPASTEASGDEGSESGGGSSNPDVVAYCEETKDLAEELQKVLADPTSGDVAALTTQAQELVTAATQLISANPDDVDEITACNQALSDALTPG